MVTFTGLQQVWPGYPIFASMHASIRKGTPEDLPAALELIRELAQYEHALDEVTISLDVMERAGFGSEKIYDFFVAEIPQQGGVEGDETSSRKGQIVGLALCYNRYSTWKGPSLFLEDLVVTQSCRRQGIGLQLFEAVQKEANNRGAARLEWQVLDWNEPAIEFYRKLNTQFDGEWLNCRIVNP